MTISSFLSRTAALGTAAGTLAFLFIGDDWRLSNLFLFPDLLVCVMLLVGAVAPERAMRALLLAGFAAGIGVFSVANASYLLEGRLGLGPFIALSTCVGGVAWIARNFLRSPA